MSISAETVNIDISKLDQNDLAAYQRMKKLEKEAQSNFSIKDVNVDNVKKYSEIGKAFGSAFKECWSTVSDDAGKFAQSSTGKWAMVLVSWKIMGSDATNLLNTIVHYTIGLTLIFISTLAFVYFFRKNCVIRPVKNIERFTFWHKKITYSDDTPIHADCGVAYWVCYVVVIIIAFAVTFS